MPARRFLARERVAPSARDVPSPESGDGGVGPARPIDPRRERIARLRQLIVERFGPQVLLDWQRPVSSSGSSREGALPADLRVLPTGILGLDLALGGGLPRGRLIELAGPPYSGKRTLAGWFVRAVQHRRGWVAYLDAAHGVDFDRWHRWGVDVLDLLVALPCSLDEALELGRLLVLAEALDLVVLDLPPHLAVRPELARGLRQLRPLLRGTPAAFVVVRDRTCEPALAAAQVRLRLEPLAQLALPGPLATSSVPDGLRVRLRIERSPRWPPRDPPVPLELSLYEGVRVFCELVDLGLASGIVVRHPLGLVFAGTVLGRTRERAAQRLKGEPELRSRLEEELRAHWVSGDRSSAELFAR
ncbi:MAG: recombinase A [Thermomicrobium sp.]|nr:recombinase A [Thermomicrobium sp.]